MTQQEHLTTEQLSAYLDKQLTPQEQAFFDAHLQSCQHCQHVLAELRGTVALLRAMPESSLPRAFTLPAGLSQTPAAHPQPLPMQERQRRIPRYMLQRTVRAVSTLAAAIAVLIILSGLLAGLGFHSGGATSASYAPATSNSSGTTHHTNKPNLTQEPQTQPGSPTMGSLQSGTPAKSPVTSTPAPTPTSTSDGTTQGVVPTPPTPPPFLDISQPSGRLMLGALLLLLSIVGLIATRRVRRSPWQR